MAEKSKKFESTLTSSFKKLSIVDSTSSKKAQKYISSVFIEKEFTSTNIYKKHFYNPVLREREISIIEDQKRCLYDIPIQNFEVSKNLGTLQFNVPANVDKTRYKKSTMLRVEFSVYENETMKKLSLICTVIKMNYQDPCIVTVQFKTNELLPKKISRANIFITPPDPYQRMLEGLREFNTNAKKNCSTAVKEAVLSGKIGTLERTGYIPPVTRLPGLGNLNKYQTATIEKALRSPFTLIQGPPGTGKTTVATSLVYYLKQVTNRPVLVCAPSNDAVNNFALKLLSAKLNVTRVVSCFVRNDLPEKIKKITLENKCLSEPGVTSEFKHYLRLKIDNPERLEPKNADWLERTLKIVERQVLEASDVICCTCSMAASKKLQGFTYKSVLIDEATQSIEPECLLPLLLNSNQVVLVGDHKQLSPAVVSDEAQKWLSLSMFERILNLGVEADQLLIQYRMHPSIAEFSNQMFYEGKLINGVTEKDREDYSKFPWPVSNIPLMFLATTEKEKVKNYSFFNCEEAQMCLCIVKKLIKGGVKPSQIAIITPYAAQREVLLGMLTKVRGLTVAGIDSGSNLHITNNGGQLEVDSVDAFQGREKDYIIFTCVRSNDKSSIGFVGDPRRLNVALTRARYGLFIVGNPETMSYNYHWRKCIEFFQNKNCLVSGTLGDYLKIKIV
jgi:regulator of nonsense transcripts 1